jgi:hypothetical protein
MTTINRRRQKTTADMVNIMMSGLSTLVANLLVKNKNFIPTESPNDPWNAKPGYYMHTYPQTRQFVHGPLKDMAEAIEDRIQQCTSYVSEVAQELDKADSELQALAFIQKWAAKMNDAVVGNTENRASMEFLAEANEFIKNAAATAAQSATETSVSA